MIDDPQTAANDQTEANVQSQTETAVTDGAEEAQEKTADQLLQELSNDWSEEESKPETKPSEEKVSDDDIAQLRRDVADIQNTAASAQFRTRMDANVEIMLDANEHLKGHYTPEDIEGRLFLRAERDKTFLQAWNNQTQNPERFRAVLQQWARELGKEVSERPDRNLTEDRNAARAAVAGISATSPQAKEVSGVDIRKMSDAELAALRERSIRSVA